MTSIDNFLQGQVLLIDKPLNWTSFQAVNAIKWALKKKFNLKKIKVGHAGTLDPLATGLLLVCTGKSTKSIATLQGQIKEYTGTIFLGATRPSYDCETEIDQIFSINHITHEDLNNAVAHFIGKIQQAPPVFSALKIDGKRAYELARKGVDTEMKKREVDIFNFELTKVNLPEIDFRVRCSKGTYIRSLAHDFGKYLNSGAYLSALRRTKIGDFNVDNALTPFETKEQIIGLSVQENNEGKSGS